LVTTVAILGPQIPVILTLNEVKGKNGPSGKPACFDFFTHGQNFVLTGWLAT
jgi:hypothetical protein